MNTLRIPVVDRSKPMTLNMAEQFATASRPGRSLKKLHVGGRKRGDKAKRDSRSHERIITDDAVIDSAYVLHEDGRGVTFVTLTNTKVGKRYRRRWVTFLADAKRILARETLKGKF